MLNPSTFRNTTDNSVEHEIVLLFIPVGCRHGRPYVTEQTHEGQRQKPKFQQRELEHQRPGEVAVEEEGGGGANKAPVFEHLFPTSKVE